MVVWQRWYGRSGRPARLLNAPAGNLILCQSPHTRCLMFFAAAYNTRCNSA
jgi:hypothetical protein